MKNIFKQNVKNQRKPKLTPDSQPNVRKLLKINGKAIWTCVSALIIVYFAFITFPLLFEFKVFFRISSKIFQEK